MIVDIRDKLSLVKRSSSPIYRDDTDLLIMQQNMRVCICEDYSPTLYTLEVQCLDTGLNATFVFTKRTHAITKYLLSKIKQHLWKEYKKTDNSIRMSDWQNLTGPLTKTDIVTNWSRYAAERALKSEES